MTVTLVLGGARSGKSCYAESLVTALPPPWAFVATAEIHDEEMRRRIAEHRARRREGWHTLEAPLDIVGALRSAPAGAPVLVDCLTLWLSNLMLGDYDIAAAVDDLARALGEFAAPVAVVSNELGLGIVPDNALARHFRDEHGRMNQRIAEVADTVVFMVAGMPMPVKAAT
jgi:adenosylcobinamide kinase/adenosylcobinamide-phosphate guanylyltransferase